jgi:hypothetical protein
MNQNEMLQEDEVSLRDMLATLLDNWKVWTLGGLLGLAVGVVAWFAQGYKGELAAVTRPGTLNFVTWSALSSGLPAFAEIYSERGETPERSMLLGRLAEPNWWKTNVSPVYAFSKGDVKDLASVSKEVLDAGATNVQRLQVRISGSNRQQLIDDMLFIERFIRQGAAYLTFKSLINRYEIDVFQKPATLRQEIAKNESELKFLSQRRETLETLRKKYPDASTASSMIPQVLDPKDSGAKYFPISTQLVALSSDINFLLESNLRASERLVELEFVSQFVEKAKPLLGSDQSSQDLMKSLALIMDDLRKRVDPANLSAVLAIRTIDRDIEEGAARTENLFEGQPYIYVTRPKLSLALALGLIGGLLLGMLFVFVKPTLVGLRSHAGRSPN